MPVFRRSRARTKPPRTKTPGTRITRNKLLGAAAAACLLLSGCADGDGTAAADPSQPLLISAIPDQDPQELAAREQAMADYLSEELGVDVEYVPVTDYAASVALFRSGDLDLVFYGGLTGVQARLQTSGASVLAQRDVDQAFESVFIANAKSGIAPIAEVSELTVFEDRRFTFGSESSTSGRLMPEYFLDRAGLDSSQDFAGDPGYSGSHDKTIDLVEAGSYEAGALNAQVWESRRQAGTVDLDKVVEVFRTPEYHDYHWMSGPDTDDRFGTDFPDKVRAALIGLDGSDAKEAAVLEAYGARKIVPSTAENYDRIEQIARKLGLIR